MPVHSKILVHWTTPIDEETKNKLYKNRGNIAVNEFVAYHI